jgi:predicted ABC-type ATPase
VDRDKVIARYYKSLDNIKRLIELCDILHVYDNTEEPVRIIRKHKEDISIFPNELWTEEKILGLIED